MLLRDRDIALVIAARFISRIGGVAAFFIGVWGLSAYRFGASARELAVVMFGMSIASLVGALVAGALVDRFGPKRVAILFQLAVVPVALLVGTAGSLSQLAPLAWLFSLIEMPVFTATTSFGPFLAAAKDRLETVNALIDGAGSAAFVLGPAAGALISARVGVAAVFPFMALCGLLAVAVLAFVRTEPVQPRTERRRAHHEIRDGLRFTYGNRWLRFYVLAGTAVWFVFGSFSTLEALFYRDVVEVSVEWLGWMNTVFGIGLLLGAALLSRLPERFFSAVGLTVAVSLVGGGAVLYVGWADLRVIAAGAFAWGLVIGATDPLLRTLMQVHSPRAYVGRVMGTAQLHRSLGELLPLALAPSLASVFGVQQVLIGGGVIAAVGALGSLPWAKRLDATDPLRAAGMRTASRGVAAPRTRPSGSVGADAEP